MNLITHFNEPQNKGDLWHAYTWDAETGVRGDGYAKSRGEAERKAEENLLEESLSHVMLLRGPGYILQIDILVCLAGGTWVKHEAVRIQTNAWNEWEISGNEREILVRSWANAKHGKERIAYVEILSHQSYKPWEDSGTP